MSHAGFYSDLSSIDNVNDALAQAELARDQALEFKEDAEAAAISADNSADASTTSSINAANSATAADASADAALISQGAASASATAADASADAALISETNAAASAAAATSAASRTVDNIAALKLLPKATSKWAKTAGYYNPGDRGDGFYYLDAADTTSADNGGTIIVANDGGRWKLNFPGFVTARQFGAKGDNVSDDSTQLQSFLTTARAIGVSGLITAGKYKFATGLVIDNSASIFYLDEKKTSLFGEGINQTWMIYTGTGTALKVIGGTNGVTISSKVFSEFSNFTLFGTAAANSIGFHQDTCQHVLTRELLINNFDIGLRLEDVDFASFHKCIIHFNNRGILANERNPRQTASTRPNGIDFVGCQIAGNTTYGATFLGGACVSFYGGDVEGNGIGGTGNRWGLLFEDSGVQGGVGANLNGVYFERNQGLADVWITNLNAPEAGLGPRHCVHNIVGCSFNRVHATEFVDHNIVCGFNKAVSFAQDRLVATGNSFKGYGAYPVNAARQYISFSNDARDSANSWIQGNIMMDDVEKNTQIWTFNCGVSRSSVQSIPNNTITTMLWDVEDYDVSGMHAASAAAITIPETGKYMVNATIEFAANATGTRLVQIRKNGLGAGGAGDSKTANAVVSPTYVSVGRAMLLTKGDTVDVTVFQDCGAALNVGINGSSFSVTALGI